MSESPAQQEPKAKQGQADRKTARSGFTLTEMVVVILIIGLVVALVGPAVFRQFNRAQSQSAETQMAAFATSLNFYRVDVGRFPDAAAGLDALVRAPAGVENWNGPYLGGTEIPEDPWNNAYIYEVLDAGRVTITSLGADGREGGEGENADIVREIF